MPRAGDTLVETITLIDPAGTPITGAAFTVVIARDPLNAAFVPVVTELGSGAYRVSYQTTAASPAGHYYAQLRANDANTQTFEVEWEVARSASTADRISATDGTSRRNLRRRAGRRLGDLLLLTATASVGSNVFKDEVNLVGGQHIYRGRQLYLAEGTPENIGEVRYVQGSSQESRSLTLGTPLPGVPAIGDVAELYNAEGTGWRIQDYHETINNAIAGTTNDAYLPVTATVTAFNRMLPSLAIPADFAMVDGVSWVDDDGATRPVIAADRAGTNGWHVDRAARTVIVGGSAARILHGRIARISGMARPALLEADDDVTPLDPVWLVEEVLAQLLAQAHLRNPTPERDRLAFMQRQMADSRRPRATSRISGNAVRL